MLVRPGVRSSAQIAYARALAEELGLPFVDLAEVDIDAGAPAELPAALLERTIALPYRVDGDELHVAVSNPGDVAALDEIRLATPLRVRFGVAPRAAIEPRLRALASETLVPITEADEYVFDEDDVVDELDADAAPAVKIVHSTIVRAAQQRASDIHLLHEAEGGLVVRFRIDGVLHDVARIPRARAAAVLARIKILARLDIAEHRRPQDGRIAMRGRDKALDIRVAVIPGVDGEAVVMRLLDKSRSAPTLTEVGLPFAMQMTLEDVIGRANGALLVTGPTGSGKSTTLYAALSDLARPEVSVVTVEDPVEYRLPAVFQMQVNPKIGVTFAHALRALLRADPDVLMVGEIRDAETAQMATEAALTGHFVLSTLHTNDAPMALMRLVDMGVEPFVVASAISAVLAQRLARRLCPECREAYTPTADEVARLGLPEQTGVLYRARGCEACSRGYSGRIGVFQLLLMNDELRRAVAHGAPQSELAAIAMRDGMRTLWDDGLEKIVTGATTVEELRRVLH